MNYEKLKEVIQKANPDIQARNISVQIPEPFGGLINYRDTRIRLADVLLAIQKANLPMAIEISIDEDLGNLALFYRMGDGKIIAVHWNLKDDNLDNQSEETKEFLIKLLCKE